MKLNFTDYKDKVYACWLGKNIGGTMGTPYEGCKEILDIQGFSTEADVVLPNDDLDLQLVWLRAVETVGANNINAELLGEFWLSYISPCWNEYGIGKANMIRGLVPPMSGTYQNSWNNSNGAWIRTEIWASLTPGCPDDAAKYAIEDAMVDHGAGEGTYAAAFVAAMQSAAFVVKDIRRIIEIGLARIPETTRVAQSIMLAIKCYDNGIPSKKARNKIQEFNQDIGDGWFEAPSNVAYSVLGLLYGEGDFKRSMITAINCGDDTDCTGATVGATLGILYGTAGIPEDWKAHIGDSIVTISVSKGIISSIPETCTELTNRVVDLAPTVLKLNGSSLAISEADSDIPENVYEMLLDGRRTRERLSSISPYSFETKFGIVRAVTEYYSAPEIAAGEEKRIKITFYNDCYTFGSIPQNLELRWLLPDGFAVSGVKSLRLPHKTSHDTGIVSAEFIIKADYGIQPINRAVLEVTVTGRPSVGYISVVFLG